MFRLRRSPVLATQALAALLLASLALAPPTQAQTDQTGVLEGRVLDPSGEEVAGAQVRGARPDGSYERTAVSGDDGRFRIGFLPPGGYVLEVSAAGHPDARLTGLRVRAAGVTTVTVELDPAGETFADEVTVTAEAPLLDSSSTEMGVTSLDSEEIDLLPVSRTATDLVELTPGARPGQVWGGSTEQANLYQLDGVMVNQPGFGGDFLLPNVDWLEEFQVRGLGAGAEYGDFQGGVINMVTKSGGNTFQGGVRLNWEDDSLSESNVNVLEAGAEQDQRWEANFDLAGPLVENRLFYFLSAQRLRGDTRIVDAAASADAGAVAFLPVQEERTETKVLGKLTWQPTPRDSIQAVLGWDDVETENRGLDSFTAPEAGQQQDSPAVFYNLAWQRPVAGSSFLEVKLTGYDGDDDRLPLNGDRPAVQILGGNRDLFTNAVYTRTRSLENYALTAGLDSFLELAGSTHKLKVGGDYNQGSWLETRQRNGNLTWRPERGDGPFDPADPATWGFISSDWGGDIRLDAETEQTALYLQDYIDLNDWLTLSAGVRAGRWEGELTPGFGGGGAFTAVDDQAFDPRVGLVADVTRDGRTLAKVHWGRYHQSLFALMFDRVEGGDAFQDLEFWDWVGDDLPDVTRNYTLDDRERLFDFFDAIPTGQEVGPALDYEQPFVDQLVVGLEREIGGDWRLGATYVNRQWEEILALSDRNLASNYTIYNNVEVIDFNTGDPVLDQDGNPLVLPTLFISNADILRRGSAPGLTPEQIAALTFDQDLVLTNVPGAEREMDQVQLVAERRGSDWSVNASLVYTDLVGNFFSVSGYDNPFGTGAGPYVNPNETTNFNGTLPNASEWEGKLRLTGRLPWGVRGGAFLLYASGDAYTPVYEIDNRVHDFFTQEGDLLNFRLLNGVSGEAVFLETRGSRELEDLTVIDLSLDRPFELGAGTLVVGATVFNLLDEDSVTAVRTLVNDQSPSDPTTLFGAPRFRQSARTVRLDLSFRW